MVTSSFNLSDLNGANGFTINGIAPYYSSGYSVSSAGDVNSDGIADLIIGAYGADPNGTYSGQSYVLFGGTNIGGTPEVTGTPRADTLIGTINKDIIDGKAGNDTIDGKAGNDLLQGGAGNDILICGAGNDTLVGGAGADRFLYNTNARFDSSAIGLDTISDFKHSQGDKIVLDKTTFSAITSAVGTGFSKASNFEVTTLGAASTAVIVYNPVTGQLYYNSNGSVAGFGVGGPFAVLTGRQLWLHQILWCKRSSSKTPSSKLGTANAELGTANVKPGAINVKPGAANVKPGAANVKPGATNVKPGATNVKPGATNVKPGTTNVKPGTANVKPGTANVKPGTANVKPGAMRVNLSPGE